MYVNCKASSHCRLATCATLCLEDASGVCDAFSTNAETCDFLSTSGLVTRRKGVTLWVKESLAYSKMIQYW